MAIVTGPALLKKSLFVLYLLEAPWITMLLTGWLVTLLIINFGAHIPDVDKMHAFVQQQERLVVATDSEVPLSREAKARINSSGPSPTFTSPEKDEQVRKSVDSLQKSNFLPQPIKAVAYIYIALFVYAPWPVGLAVTALFISLANGIWFLFHTFRKGFFWGLGCIFVPFVSTVFEYKFWKEVRRPFELGLFCNVLFGIVGGAAFGAYSYVPPGSMQNSFVNEISLFKQPAATKMDVHSSDVVLLPNNGDAFFQTALAAVASSDKGRSQLKEMVKTRGNKYIVKFNGSEPVEIDDSNLSASHNRDKIAAIIESAFLANYDVDDIKKQLAKDGTPAITVALQLLAGDDIQYVKASDLTEEETKLLLTRLVYRCTPVVISSKKKQELVPDERRLASACYAVIGADLESRQVLLFNCTRNEIEPKETIPGVENLGNGLIRMPLKLFPQYVRFISFPEKW